MVTYEVIIPPEVKVDIDGKTLRAKGKLGECTATLPAVPKQEKERLLFAGSDNKRSKSQLGTAASHAENAIRGVTEGFNYKLKVVYAHFPINVSTSGKNVVIKNFLGEKSPRFARIEPNVKVETSGQEVAVSGTDIRAVSQTAANIESATRITGRDARVFQDGIYIVSR